mmetsp:Transcript_8137/g.27954  ORF Transcript_8137/g.27954 Transcript_8137/m.27954 type:complete len:212 (+) Transcript_8137:247-882(+)
MFSAITDFTLVVSLPYAALISSTVLLPGFWGLRWAPDEDEDAPPPPPVENQGVRWELPSPRPRAALAPVGSDLATGLIACLATTALEKVVWSCCTEGLEAGCGADWPVTMDAALDRKDPNFVFGLSLAAASSSSLLEMAMAASAASRASATSLSCRQSDGSGFLRSSEGKLMRMTSSERMMATWPSPETTTLASSDGAHRHPMTSLTFLFQ